MLVWMMCACLLQSVSCEMVEGSQGVDGGSFSVQDTEEIHHVTDKTFDNQEVTYSSDSANKDDIVKSETQTFTKKESKSENDQTEMSEEVRILGDQSESVLSEEKGTTQNNPEVFSLTNFIKKWLNPVLQEFQEGLNLGKDKNETELSNSTQITTVKQTNETHMEDIKNITDTSKKMKFNCTGRNVTENTTAVVRIVNSTTLLDFLSFDKNNNSTDCVLIMFYAPWCPFCAKTAAQFNAVGRAFKQLDVLAVDAIHFSNLNARFGTVAVPNIMVFHQSRSAVRFNQTNRSFQQLVEFVTNVTGLEANSSIEVEEEDFIGPLSSIPTVESDYLLWCAWIFILLCTSHLFINSRYGQGAIDKVRTLWQEHQHIE
ncbi:thioredoxin domain-containing protein 15 isoform X2 [Patella vulgata]|nr:thioredoxin domain-containing protein 15 isoform X2 [Patella vulgata]